MARPARAVTSSLEVTGGGSLTHGPPSSPPGTASARAQLVEGTGDGREHLEVAADRAESGVHGVDRQVRGARRRASGRPGRRSFSSPASVQLTRPSMPIEAGSRPAAVAASAMIAVASSSFGPGGDLREPAVGEPPDAAVGRRRLPADPDRDRPLQRAAARARRPSPDRTRRRGSRPARSTAGAAAGSARSSAARATRRTRRAPRTRRRSSRCRRRGGSVPPSAGRPRRPAWRRAPSGAAAG